MSPAPSRPPMPARGGSGDPPPLDPLDAADAALKHTRSLLKDAALEDEITVNVHVNTVAPQPSAPELVVPTRPTLRGVLAGVAGLVSAALALAKALGLLD